MSTPSHSLPVTPLPTSTSRAASPSPSHGSHPLRPATPLSSSLQHTPRDDPLSSGQQISASTTDEDIKAEALAPQLASKYKAREVVRIDRDYSDGDLPQFFSGYPSELEGRVTPVQHLNLMNELNSLLASANDPYKSVFDNLLAVLTFYLSTLCYRSHYQREMQRFTEVLDRANQETYNTVGLRIRDPRRTAMLFLEIEYH